MMIESLLNNRNIHPKEKLKMLIDYFGGDKTIAYVKKYLERRKQWMKN